DSGESTSCAIIELITRVAPSKARQIHRDIIRAHRIISASCCNAHARSSEFPRWPLVFHLSSSRWLSVATPPGQNQPIPHPGRGATRVLKGGRVFQLAFFQNQ